MLFKIAFRNIFRQKRRTVFTALTMFGGFTLAAISIGWSDGTYSSIINMFTRNNLGHIQVHAKGYLDKPSIYNTINNYESAGDKILEVAGVEAWTPRLFSAGLASFKNKSSLVRVIGIDPQREQEVTNFRKKIFKGAYFSNGPLKTVILGKGLSEVLGAGINDTVVIVSQASDGSMANDVYTVRGISDSGDKVNDRMAFYLNLKDAQELFVLPGRVHEIAVIVRDINKVYAITAQISKKLNDPLLETLTWQEFASSFYQAMSADKEGMWIMIFVIMLIVAVGVLNTVLMSVLERTREYGVLRAIGTSPLEIFWQVIIEVNVIAIGSVFIGAVLSLAVNYLLSIHGITLPEPFTYGGMEFRTMQTVVNLRSFYLPAIIVMVSASLISIFPALRAARIEPARAMRIH